jgi:hypothetical protein
MKNTFKNAKIGDRVWSMAKGWGEVVAIGYDMPCPIVVEFPDYGRRPYSLDGRYNKNDINPELFWGEIKLEVPKPPLPKLEVDTKVIVWDGCYGTSRRHFSHFDSDGNIHCFTDGATKWSSGGATKLWNNWKLAEKETK